MARGLNKVQLIGRLGGDPDIKYTQQGTPVANFSMATTEQWTREGEKQSRTTWHKIVAWRKLAEIVGQYVHKGDMLYVEGKLQTDQWEKDGQRHYTTKVVIDQMIMLGSRGGDPDGHDPNRYPTDQGNEPESQGGPNGPPATADGQEVDDDIPF